jgi:thiazole/oxazole-forming peptide maturase SagD family component
VPHDGLWRAGFPLLAAAHHLTGSVMPRAREFSPRAPDKHYPRMPQIPLPPRGALPMALGDALMRRRSARAFGRAPVPLDALSAVLAWSAGLTDDRAPWPRRAYPSGGAYYPYELYVIARAVVGLPRGLYHWHAPTHTLAALPCPAPVRRLWRAILEPRFRPAAAAIVITGRPDASLTKYGPRAYRFLLLSAGAIMQNLYLATAALGLAGTAIGIPADHLLERALGLPGASEMALTFYVLGSPGPAPDAPPPPWAWPAEVTERDPWPGALARCAVPLDDLRGIAWEDTPTTRSACRLLRGAARTLGVHALADVPAPLAALPREAWRAWPAIRRVSSMARLAVRPVVGRPDDPGGLPYWSAVIDGRHFGAGIHPEDQAEALRAAVAEAVERWLWHTGVRRDRVRVAAPADLGAEAIDLEALAGYDAALRRGTPRLQWDATTRLAWVAGTSLTDGRRRWVPLQCVTASACALTTGEPELRPRTTNGLAAGATLAAAQLHGALEVLERDAFMLAWLGRTTPARLAAEAVDDPTIQDLLGRFERARLRPWAFLLPTDTPAHVVLVAVENLADRGPAVAFAAAARLSCREALRHALLEGVQCWVHVRALHDRLDVPAERHTLDRTGRLLWWTPRERWASLDWLRAGPVVALPADNPLALGAPEAQVAHLAAWFARARYEAVAVELTDSRLAAHLGVHVVGVVIPACHPLHLDERRPVLWSRRLEARLDGRAPNPDPHPFP